MQVLNEKLLVVRRERLRAIYKEDRASWQASLAERGLSVEVSRD
jgi:hypothetical protein